MRRIAFVLALVLTLGSALLPLSSCKKVKPKENYYYAVVNSKYLTAEDAAAIDCLISAYSDHDVFVIDTADCQSALDVYERLASDADTRTGKLNGIQIFGTSHMVPAFFVDDKTAWADSVSVEDAYLTDYFYGNFENSVALLEGFSVADHFANGAEIDFVPQWPVARLTLSTGEFSAYIERYRAYQETQTPVQSIGLASPIFRFDSVAVDDMAHFLNRAAGEWGLLDNVRLYANQQGDFPVSTGIVIGDITLDALRAENEAAVCEIYFGGHGDQYHLFRTKWEDGMSNLSVCLDASEIGEALEANPYYLNLWACSSAEGMDYNFVHTVLQESCLGAFAATSEFNNNGVDCSAAVEDMAQNGNFYYFYYSYLEARHQNRSRSTSFFDAQVKYASALADYAKEPVNYGANYQCAYNNLLAYTNIGIIEPEYRIPTTAETELASGETELCAEYLTVKGGSVDSEPRALTTAVMSQNGMTVARVYNVNMWELNNGYMRFACKVDAKEAVLCGLLTKVESIQTLYTLPQNDALLIIFDIKKEYIQDGMLALYFRALDDRFTSVTWTIKGLK